jgi:hypothetical protein
VDTHQALANRGFTVIGVSLDEVPHEDVPGFVKEYRVPYTILLPSFSVTGSNELTGSSGDGEDRAHFNGTGLDNAARRSTERDHFDEIVVGYGRKLGDGTVVVGDLVREQEQRIGREANIFELGLRQRIGEKVIFSVGAEAGVKEESPNARVTLRLEWNL